MTFKEWYAKNRGDQPSLYCDPSKAWDAAFAEAKKRATMLCREFIGAESLADEIEQMEP